MIVHILRHGHPLCMFTNLLPGDWPRGHVWISIADAASAGPDVCEECADEHEWIKAAKEIGDAERAGILPSSTKAN
jgi:hypothetical protein